jgi:K+-transporting ATPase ATPase C chain
LLCSGAYPAVLWAVGQSLFLHQAEGSLLDKDGKPTTDPTKAVGSRLIARKFDDPKYFQPRPSNAGSGYDASASSGSNFGASNPLLRERVARAVGAVARYQATKEPVGPDVEKWFAERPKDFVQQWAADHPTSAGQWVKDHPDAVVAYLDLRGKDATDVKDNADKNATAFFTKFATEHPNAWPVWESEKDKDGNDVKGADDKPVMKLTAAVKGDDVQAYLFDAWLTARPKDAAPIEPVPADMVMASGSGLDPHITLKNALYQLDRVADAWAKSNKLKKETVQAALEKLLRRRATAPFGGAVGVPLVNVLEINLELRETVERAGS